ncbi:M56 family metallopeptidase [Aldersonia sp. NBC_00410]|uniref:M56 family metallopeptidase n=1 Tax=Aldersonia sp. NBC_00410 TaxID=2975954 RepID=UPI002251ACD5|nr:M56 family metallopeptidase [Aldersonia sp. NBC_00410]MCX5045032.1 M56 family metallopeptidase [Aldersonia sp. NBC_00410]
MMMHAIHHVGAVLAAILTMGALLGRSWQYRCPHVAVLLWQAAVVSFGIGMVGLLLAAGLSPELGAPAPALRSLWLHGTPSMHPLRWLAVVAGVALACWIAFTVVALAWDTTRRRMRVRSLLALVGTHDAAVDGVEVLQHPDLTAYCVPGWHPRVVVSSGTIATLRAPELRSVLAHERAHARERHDLALLPMVAASRTLGHSRLGRAIRAEVTLLVEMCADESAARECGRTELARALRRFGDRANSAPGGALGATAGVQSRCARLEDPPAPLPGIAIAALLAIADALVVLPTVLLLVQP